MGNNSSKPKDLRGSPLSRTDTGNSAKSSRSIRSRISMLRDDNSTSGSPKTGSKATSRKNSSTSLNNMNSSSHSMNIPINGNNSAHSNNNSSANLSNSFSNLSLHKNPSNQHSNNNFNLPPSMIQVEPKEPILIRRNTGPDGEDTPLSPKNHSFNSNSPHLASSFDNSNPSSNPSNNISRTSTNHSHHSGSINNYPLSPQPTSSSANGSTKDLQEDTSKNFDSQLLNENRNKDVLINNLLHSSTTESNESDDSGSIDIENLIQRLLDAGYSGKKTKSVCLKNHEIQLICAKARNILLLQPSLLELSPPVKVVGDVHGQYGDLIRIFTKCGFPPQTNYLFLGDYVDRGKQSLETILLLLCYKIKYPENFFLLRGNHECANVTRVYGFYDECKRRCNIKTWKLFIDTFNTLPIAAIVAGKIFCVHGGLSPVLNSMEEIRNIARPTDVPDFGLLNDLLWSDPADTMNEWEDNERGVSYVFSRVAINKFLQKFGFDLVCRAHMVVEDGYEFFNDRTLVTVFSAPNYCGEFDNWGAVMSVSDELLCLFELLDPLDSIALKQVMKKGKEERKNAQLQQL